MYIFVDFDDTLYLHEKHWKSEEEDLRYNGDVAFGRYKFDKKLVNTALIDELLEWKREKDAVIILITRVTNSMAVDEKKYFINKLYPNLIDASVGVSHTRYKYHFVMDFLAFHAEKYNIEKDDIIVIDDSMELVGTLNENGIKAFVPQLIQHMRQQERKQSKEKDIIDWFVIGDNSGPLLMYLSPNPIKKNETEEDRKVRVAKNILKRCLRTNMSSVMEQREMNFTNALYILEAGLMDNTKVSCEYNQYNKDFRAYIESIIKAELQLYSRKEINEGIVGISA